MALWQFDLILIPRPGLKRILGCIPLCVSQEQIDTENWWSDITIPDAYRDQLARILPPAESWHPETEIWGEQDGNRIDVFKERGQIAEVRIRVDARHHDRRFIEAIADLASGWDCVLIGDDLQVIPPLPSEIESALESSAARAFTRDPYGYLEANGPSEDSGSA